MPRRSHLIAAGGLFVLLLAYNVLGAIATIDFLRHSSSPGWINSFDTEVVRVAQVRPGGPAEGKLRRGDEVVAFEGRGVRRGFDVRGSLLGRRPGDSNEVLIRRDGRLIPLRLATTSWGFSFSTLLLGASMVVAFVFLAAGAAVLVLKPLDKQAYLLSLTFILFAGYLGPRVPISALSDADLVFVVTAQLVGVFLWPVFLHFFLVFPERSPLLRRFPWLERGLYLIPVAFLPYLMALLLLFAADREAGLAFEQPATLTRIAVGSISLYLLGGLASLVLNYRQAGRASRRKLRVVVVGVVLGLLPLLVVLGLAPFVDITNLSLWVARTLFVSFTVGLLLMPLSFVYAIVRHQVIPIRLMIRRSIRYLLVANGFFLIEALVLLAALAFLLSGRRAAWLDGLGGRADIVATVLVSSLVIALLTLVHRRMMPAIDRRFFRAEYDAQKLLSELGVAAREVRSVDELLDFAAERMQEALQPESLGVFLLDEASGNYTCVVPRGGGAAVLRADSSLATALRRSPALRDTEAGGLILPIVTKGDLLGMLSLGPRRGDLPYAREDRRLLEAVAWQLAFAIENSRLVRRMVQEERLRRELALASEVQRRLFPEQPPTIGGLDLAGLCYPAQGVGGDYYDFLDLGRGRVGLAVADVAGKGISAALLMSIVQASLRSHASDPDAPLTDQVASMNRLLYRSTARNSFASFFYARFDADTRRLVYVNAGHNPPLLVRAGGAEGGAGLLRRALTFEGGVAVEAPVLESAAVELLKAGGIVLGATENATYQQQSARLEPGDVLVAYTDGVTEAWSPEGEEFGEDRLCAIALAARGLSAREIADRIVLGVRGWVRDAPQSDDLTLVVAKVG